MSTTATSTSPVQELYEVFGRLTSNDVLAHVGSIRAPNDDLAMVRARYLCGQRYRELCLAPARAFLQATVRRDGVAVKEF